VFNKGLVVVGATLVLCGFFVTTSASAARRGGHGSRHHMARRAHAVRHPHRFTSHTNTDFGFSGPYIGVKSVNH
jgi:hypothetical protein